MTCSLCGGAMRVERRCSICERAVCSKCSRPMGMDGTACHACIPPDFSGASARSSWRRSTDPDRRGSASVQGETFRRLMREKERARADAATEAWRSAGYPTPALDEKEEGGNG